MASTQQNLGGEVKQKNVIMGGRSRRVLQDIGNVVPGRQPQGKKAISEIVNAALAGNAATRKGAAAPKVAPQKKVVPEKPQPETRTDIKSSNGENSGKPNSSRKLRGDGSSKKKTVKSTFTSVLNARSKAASGLATKEKDPVLDIDVADVDNELAVVEYVDDIYNFYKLTESESGVHDYMEEQPDINPKMRSILVDWLIEVHRKFELMPETLYLTINIVDRYLSNKVVSRRQLQLVGISSMLIACKYEEIWAPEVNDFVCISDNAYPREQVLIMEKSILGKLEWELTVPTPYVFLVRYIKASISSDKEMEDMVFFLAELGLMQYRTTIQYKPSMLAASAVYAARCTLERSPFWSETLKHHTGYSEEQLRECAKMLVKSHSEAGESKLKAVYRKYSSVECELVALAQPAKSLLVVPHPEP